jgi:ubiquinone/menaquinone biosynthesis C-methylase UbiE
MRLFRKSQLEDLPVTMAGVKLGDRLLVAGCSDPRLIAALAVKTGLTGHACAVDDAAERTANAARVAQTEGALIETITTPLSKLPLDDATFDIVLLRDVLSEAGADAPLHVAQEAWRILRPGGRCLAVESTVRGGLTRFLGAQHPKPADPARVMDALNAAQFRGVRTLADREGLLFVEGTKPASM